METELITALIDYSEGKKIKTFGTKLNAIEHNNIFNSLRRVFNEGRGSLLFAEMDQGILLINEMLLSAKEVRNIKENLKISYELVSLCYPDYYSKNLSQMRKK